MSRPPPHVHGKKGSTVRVRQRALQKPRKSEASLYVFSQSEGRLRDGWSRLWSFRVENAVPFGVKGESPSRFESQPRVLVCAAPRTLIECIVPLVDAELVLTSR
jgi:hypothetical protein